MIIIVNNSLHDYIYFWVPKTKEKIQKIILKKSKKNNRSEKKILEY
jgi:hypothetical protein